MKIGELASHAEVNVQTIRFYEREGLLRKPDRAPNGYRTYTTDDAERVKFIRVCQGLGFALREVRQLIKLHGVASGSVRPVPSAQARQNIVSIAHERLSSIEEKIEELSRMKMLLQSVIGSLSSTDSPRCPAAVT
jgi:DNA-binding transcriptional MerR regulator